MKLGFGKPKQRNPLDNNAETPVTTRLKDLCGGDGDFYGAMSRLMFLDPKRITAPLDRVLADARESEAKGDKLRAEVSYRIAGGIALYRADTASVKNYFGKAASFAGDTRPEYQVILKQSEEAVNIATKYYNEIGSVSSPS